MSQLAMKLFKLLLVIYVFFFAFEWWRPIPDAISSPSAVYAVPDSGVKFLSELEKKDGKSATTTGAAIENRYKELLRGAAHIAFISEYYFPESSTSTLTTLIAEKHASDKHVAIAILTDAISTRYGGIVSAGIEHARKNGAVIIETDMDRMPDGNLFYTSLWRPFFSWWGNTPTGGWLPDPIKKTSQKVSLRTWLSFFNTKASNSHSLLADTLIGKELKHISLISSDDISAVHGSTGKVALEVDDKLWQEMFKKDATIAEMSHSGLPFYSGSEQGVDAGGTLAASLVDVGHLRERIVALIGELNQGNHLDIAVRYLSDRAVMTALKDAANRSVTIRIILDPNQEVMGSKLYGIPNRPVAKELTARALGGISVRWCDPRALPCGARMLIGNSATSTFILLGGADLTGKNIGGANVQTEVLVESTKDFAAHKDAQAYFEKIWNNTGGNYTVDYATFEDNSLWRGSLYRIMEWTGLSYY